MSGKIYKATNKLNGKSYIGQTEKTLEYRKKNHFFRSRFGSRYAFHLAIKKYGIDGFTWEIIADNIPSKSEMDRIEIEEIRKQNTIAPNGYNISTGGGGGDNFTNNPRKEAILEHARQVHKGKKLSPETRRKMSLARMGNQNTKGHRLSEEHKRKIGLAGRGRPNPMKGKHISEETKRKISAFQKGRKKSEEHRQKIIQALTGLKRTPETCARIRAAKLGSKWTEKQRQMAIGRFSGERNPFFGKKHNPEDLQRKLTLQMVGEIKTKLSEKPEGMKWIWLYKKLAAEYGVSFYLVGKIRRGAVWKGIGESANQTDLVDIRRTLKPLLAVKATGAKEE